jgi:hypothetical protein
MPRFKTKNGISSHEEVRQLLCNTEQVGGCMVWKGAINSDGYPKLARIGYDGVTSFNVKGHRHVYEHMHGATLQKDIVIRHSCHNTRCLHPNHLTLGSATDNMEDRQTAGRTYKQVLSSELENIICMHNSGSSGVAIAKSLGCNVKRIYYVLKKYKGD